MTEAVANAVVSVVISLVAFLFARSQLTAKLEEKAASQQKEIDELKIRLNNEFLASIDRMREKLESLNVKVERALERIEHISKKPVHIDEGDLKTLLDMIAEVQKK